MIQFKNCFKHKWSYLLLSVNIWKRWFHRNFFLAWEYEEEHNNKMWGLPFGTNQKYEPDCHFDPTEWMQWNHRYIAESVWMPNSK